MTFFHVIINNVQIVKKIKTLGRMLEKWFGEIKAMFDLLKKSFLYDINVDDDVHEPYEYS